MQIFLEHVSLKGTFGSKCWECDTAKTERICRGNVLAAGYDMDGGSSRTEIMEDRREREGVGEARRCSTGLGFMTDDDGTLATRLLALSWEE